MKNAAPPPGHVVLLLRLGLIAQETLTDTCSVSSPCATGADAAMPPAILRNGIGPGEPSSAMLKGAPSVTPAAFA